MVCGRTVRITPAGLNQRITYISSCFYGCDIIITGLPPQALALRDALLHEVAVMQGPPGTGGSRSAGDFNAVALEIPHSISVNAASLSVGYASLPEHENEVTLSLKQSPLFHYLITAAQYPLFTCTNLFFAQAKPSWA